MLKKELCYLQLFLPVILISAMAGSANAGCEDDRKPGMDWSGCQKTHKILDKENFTGSQFHQTNLSSSNLKETDFTRANMIKVNLTRSQLDRARFDRTDLFKAEGYRASFVGARFNDARLSKSEFSRADFSKATFENIDWEKAELGRADFTGAKLKQVNFDYTDLSRSRFSDATISEVYFTRAYTYLTKFEAVDLRRAVNLTQPQLDMACGDDRTLLPDGLVASVNWPCEE